MNYIYLYTEADIKYNLKDIMEEGAPEGNSAGGPQRWRRGPGSGNTQEKHRLAGGGFP